MEEILRNLQKQINELKAAQNDDSSSVGSSIPDDPRCVEWFDKMMTKMDATFENANRGMWLLIKSAYNNKKEAFQVSGGLHSDKEGTRVYYSARHNLVGNAYATIHVYGHTRFEKFIVSELSYNLFEQKHSFKFEKKFIKPTY